MTTLANPGAPAGAGVGVWRAEMGETIKLAMPMALTQLGQIAMMTTDLAMLGRLGESVVAAAALAHAVLFAAFVVGMGIASAVAPLAAQAFGAREPRIVRRALRVGLQASLFVGIPMTLAMLNGAEILVALGQAPEAAALAERYMDGLAWCLAPAWAFLALRGFMGAVNRPEPALWITLAAIPANAALAWCLIYGELGLPRLELLGAGVATTIVNIGMCAAAMWIVHRQRPFRKYHPLGRFWRADWPRMGQLFAVGLPISGAFLLEVGLFAGAALLMGRIGTAAIAAHQIAIQTASILFMVPFGISMAATVRVGQAVGREDAVAARRAGFVAIALAAGFMAAMTVLVALFREEIPPLFLGGGQAGETAALAATLLVVGATFFVADGAQTVAAGALRGLNDTRVPMLFAALGFWAIGFPSAYGLGFHTAWGAVGVWIGLSLGVVAFAALLIARFHLLTRGSNFLLPSGEVGRGAAG